MQARPAHPTITTARQPCWRLALLLWLLAASCVQQWAAQSHWHAVALRGEAALQAPAGDRGEGLPAHDCLLCHAAAHVGVAAPPPALQALVLADAPVASLRGITRAAQLSAPLAWSWQSRGPPRA